MQGAPEVKAARRTTVTRSEVCVDRLAFDEALAEAEGAIEANGRKGPGVEGPVLREQGCKGAGGAQISTCKVGLAHGCEGAVVKA